jgi:hypothetical protein
MASSGETISAMAEAVGFTVAGMSKLLDRYGLRKNRHKGGKLLFSPPRRSSLLSNLPPLLRSQRVSASLPPLQTTLASKLLSRSRGGQGLICRGARSQIDNQLCKRVWVAGAFGGLVTP